MKMTPEQVALLNAQKARHDPLLWEQMRNANAEGRLPDPYQPGMMERAGSWMSSAFGSTPPANETLIAKTSPVQGQTPITGLPDQTPATLEERRRIFGQTGGMSERATPEVPMPGRNPMRKPMSPEQARNMGRATIARDLIGDFAMNINSQLGIDPDEADEMFHSWADSGAGRKLTDMFINGQNDPKKIAAAQKQYEKFARSYVGAPSMSKTKTAKPVVIPVDMIKTGKDLDKVVKYADKAPVVLNNASNLGFSSDQVMIVKGDQPAPDPQKVLASARPPVLSQRGFGDVVRGMMKR